MEFSQKRQRSKSDHDDLDYSRARLDLEMKLKSKFEEIFERHREDDEEDEVNVIDFKREIVLVNGQLRNKAPHNATSTSSSEEDDFERDAGSASDLEEGDFEHDVTNTTDSEANDFERDAGSSSEFRKRFTSSPNLQSTISSILRPATSPLSGKIAREQRKSARNIWEYPLWPGETPSTLVSNTIIQNGNRFQVYADHSAHKGEGLRGAKRRRTEILQTKPVQKKPGNLSRRLPHLTRFKSSSHEDLAETNGMAMHPCYDQNSDESVVSSSTEDEDTLTERSQKDQSLCISRLNRYGTQSSLKVTETNQSRRFAGKVQKTPSESSEHDLEHSPDIPRGTHVGSVPCLHPDCATHPRLYRSGRIYSNEDRSELIQHIRQVHEESLFSCQDPHCWRKDKDGYFRHHDLVKHLKNEHPLLSPGTILRNKNLDWYGKSEEKVASRRVLCPHRDCATLTKLYRSGRLSNEARSELTEHTRREHEPPFPCTVKDCSRQGKDGYFRHHDLLKHLEREHELYPSDKILHKKQIDLYSESEDELA